MGTEVCAYVEAPLEDSIEELDVLVVEVDMALDKLEVVVVELEDDVDGEDDFDGVELDGVVEELEGTGGELDVGAA